MSRRRLAGFTLVELLVVIGIIALLISILLPALNKARRSANTVKCASSLKQIFNAFKLYEIDNRGYWPVTRLVQTAAMEPAAAYRELHWTDMVSKYVHKNGSRYASDITQVRRSSVIWGCPEYSKIDDYKATGTNAEIYADAVRNGYGMTHYTVIPHLGYSTAAPYSAANPRFGTNAYLDYSTPSIGTWHKATTWQRRSGNGSAGRGLIADSNLVWIDALSTFSKTLGGFQMPGSTATVPNTTNGYVNIDAGRHSKPGISIELARKTQGTNLLFCDGHVTIVSPPEAWAALRNDGFPTTTP